MGYDRYPGASFSGGDDYTRDYGSGRDYTYSSARDYESAGMMGNRDRQSSDDRPYGGRDYGNQRYGQRDQQSRYETGRSGGGYGMQTIATASVAAMARMRTAAIPANITAATVRVAAGSKTSVPRSMPTTTIIATGIAATIVATAAIVVSRPMAARSSRAMAVSRRAMTMKSAASSRAPGTRFARGSVTRRRSVAANMIRAWTSVPMARRTTITTAGAVARSTRWTATITNIARKTAPSSAMNSVRGAPAVRASATC